MGEDVRLKKNKTTKLIYNESTKLIEVKPDTESNFQVFLEKKKIYFETIMMLILVL